MTISQRFTLLVKGSLNAVLDSLEMPGPETQLLVLEAKAVATETAVAVTDAAMRTCGGYGGSPTAEGRPREPGVGWGAMPREA